MHFGHINGESEPMVLYKPFIYKTVVGCEEFNIIKKYDGETYLIDKKTKRKVKMKNERSK